MPLQQAKDLALGDTIGIVAPSFGCTSEPYATRYKEAVRLLRARGYKLKVGSCVFKNDGLGISTNPYDAAKELENFYLDPNIDAIISAGGGELMCETISHIDFDKIKDAPAKIFMGYSDNTNFIFPLLTLCGKQAIYGSCISGFGKSWEAAEWDAINLLEGTKKEFEGYPLFQLDEAESESIPQKKELKVFKGNSIVQSTEFSGLLIGGCLDVLNNLAGSKFDAMKAFTAKHKNIIWALEACDLSPLDIRRALWHLKECSWFENASGFIIGRPLAAWKQAMMGVDQYNAVTGILADLNLPIIMDADIGHIDPTLPLLMGAEAKVRVENGNWKISFL